MQDIKGNSEEKEIAYSIGRKGSKGKRASAQDGSHDTK